MTELEICEVKFKEWLDEHNYGYLHISQDIRTFSNFFRDLMKRPDFLIVLPSISIIAVDVKYYTKYPDFIFDEGEVKSFSAFERYLRLPVWYAVAASKRFTTWHWISNSEVLEKGIRKPSKSGYFYKIDPKSTKQIASNENIAKIFV